MTEQNRVWNGRSVFLRQDEERVGYSRASKPVRLTMTPEAAEELRRFLAKGVLTFMIGDPRVAELLSALEYVLTGSERATRNHRLMESAKGMEPSGG